MPKARPIFVTGRPSRTARRCFAPGRHRPGVTPLGLAAILFVLSGAGFRDTVGLDFTKDRPVAKYTGEIDWSLVGFINLDVYDETWDAAAQTTPENSDYAGVTGPTVNPNAWAEFKRQFGG